MQRPTSVTVFGVLNIIIGVWGLIGGILALGLLVTPLLGGIPSMRELWANGPQHAWIALAIPLGLVGHAAAVVAGIGLLRMLEWARLLSIGYAIYAAALSIIGMGLSLTLLIAPMVDHAARQADATASLIGFGSGIVGGLLGLIYPVLLFVYMTRPNVVQACRPNAITVK